MEYKYDAETDILMIILSRDKPDFAEQRENIITHYNKDGKPVQIEILDASRAVGKMSDAVSRAKRDVMA